ncbi:MAG TPA: 50S ribosomal protein L29 [Thermoproteales archaeon]|nr:50S ribosomal protein L29 [Thermoproteales archaeon]
MPQLKAKDIRKMSPEERRERLRELRIELIRLRGMLASGSPVENPNRIKEIKRTIARILTVERELSK